MAQRSTMITIIIGLIFLLSACNISTAEPPHVESIVSQTESDSVSLTTPAPDPTGADIEQGTSNTTTSIPFMGITFIIAAVVLIFIAVKRGEKKE